MRHRPRAERLPQLLVPALADQVQVQITERGQEPVRVLDLLNGTVVRHAEPVLGHALQRHQPREEPVPVVMQLRPQLPCHDRHSTSERPKRPEGDPAGDRVGAEHGVGGVVGSVEEPVPVGGVQGGGDGGGGVRGRGAGGGQLRELGRVRGGRRR